MLALALLLATALDADPEFQKALQHAEAFEYDKAAPMLKGVAGRPGLPPTDRAQALVWLGLVYAELRDEARAALAFEDAISADPLIVLPRDASPKTKALLEDARARVRLRTQAGPAPTPPTTPPPLTPAPAPAPVPAPAPAAGGSVLGPVGIGTMAVGGAVTVVGGVVWGVGLMLLSQAEAEPYQDEAARLGEQSAVAQVGGQVTAGVGVVALAAGAVLFAVSAME